MKERKRPSAAGKSAVALGVLLAVLVVNQRAEAAPASSRIKPEMRVRFPQSAIACITREALGEAMVHGLRGEETKMRSMFQSSGNPDAPCVMLSSRQTFKVLSVTYPDDDTDMGLLELVSDGNRMSNGAFALSIGARPVRK